MKGWRQRTVGQGSSQGLPQTRFAALASLALGVLSFVGTIYVRAGDASASVPRLPGVGAAMQAAIDAREVAGAVTVVVTKDKVLHLEANGMADLAAAKPMQPDSRFWIASMTKPVTAVAVLMLQDEGKLNVTDPVAKYIPAFAGLKTPSGKPANLIIAQILTHTSGLGEAPAAGARNTRTLADLVPLWLAAPMQYEPGAKWQYTQSGINLAARIVEVVSGLSFDTFVQQRILDPLGMKNTTFYPAENSIVTAYAKNRTAGALEPTPPRSDFGVRDRPPLGNGGLYSTGPDYARFCQMLLGGGVLEGRRYLSPAAMKLLTAVQTGSLPCGFFQSANFGNRGSNYGWGIGTCILRTPHEGVAAMLSPGTFGHGGAWGTQAWIDPVRGVAYILMVQRSNFPNSDASDVRRTFQQAAVDALAKQTISADYHFDGTISREVLENYLDRSVTMAYFLIPGKNESNYEYLYRDDDVRLIRNIGAKFIGRAIYRWNGESRLNDPNFWKDAKALIEKVYAFDPDVIFQGCLFETISRDVDRVKIPAWVFKDLSLPVEDRTFSYNAMLNKDGKLVNHWGRASVPDVTRPETQLWFYYLAGSYIDLGCEALHLGQVGLIGMADRDLKEWSRVIAKIRAYAKTHARRHLVLLDAHVPTGGMIVDGVSLLDFNSFPMRIKAIPDKPHEGELQVGHLDSLYKRSKGCTSPSGWNCQSLPYLVEFDNFGRSRTPNVADTKSIFVWGWDEISWFSLQPEEYRNKFLVYAYHWLKETDPNGHLQMPVSRMLSCPNESQGNYRANTKSSACPIGYSQEETIKKLWNGSAK